MNEAPDIWYPVFLLVAGYPEHPWYGEVRTISTGTSLSNDDIGKFTDIHYTENKYKLQYYRDLFHACTV